MPESRPLIPPRGVFIPTSVAYNRALPAAILQTWVQLRGLAWGDTETPPISMKQLVEITGKSQSCLYGQMASLRLWGALRWRPSAKGTFIVSFEAEPDPASANSTGDVLQDSRNLEMPDLDPSIIQSSQMNEEDIEGKFQDSGNVESFAKKSGSPDSGGRKTRSSPERDPAARCYHQKMGIHPNSTQRQMLADQVTDLALWETTLEHWLSHGWSPRNIVGQLQLYQRGGPGGCLYCQKEKDPLNQTIETLEQLRKELSYG